MFLLFLQIKASCKLILSEVEWTSCFEYERTFLGSFLSSVEYQVFVLIEIAQLIQIDATIGLKEFVFYVKKPKKSAQVILGSMGRALKYRRNQYLRTGLEQNQTRTVLQT